MKPFNYVVEAFRDIQGKLIFCGLGKSGHIARKIAATCASTGTLHFCCILRKHCMGDLGMIGENDGLVLLSHSGETIELVGLAEYAKKFGIPSVLITSRTQSTLAKKVNFVLALPHVSEVCPFGLAPTTSTTMMLALGDALGLALSRFKTV